MVIDGKFRIGRFERDFGDNREWLEFVEKDINELDDIDIIKFKRLIAHEYIEAKLMEKGIYFRSFINPDNMFVYDNGAHWLSTDLNNGFKFISFGQMEMPPKIDEKNLSNLDRIVEYYIDLLKL